MSTAFDHQPATLDQLPPTAAEYYRTSTLNTGLFTYVLQPKRDCCGRKVYQKFFDGEPWDSPRALLTYREYKNKVMAWVPYKGLSMGLSRWATATYND